MNIITEEKVWNELEDLGGGFNCTIKKAKAAAIAEGILRLAETSRKIVELMK